MTELKSRWIGTEDAIKTSHEARLKPDRLAKLRTVGMPMSIHRYFWCARSSSARDGAATSCMKKLDEARMRVPNTLSTKWRKMLRPDAVPQDP